MQADHEILHHSMSYYPRTRQTHRQRLPQPHQPPTPNAPHRRRPRRLHPHSTLKSPIFLSLRLAGSGGGGRGVCRRGRGPHAACQCEAAAPVDGGGAWPNNDPTRQATRQYTMPHWCGGRRRDLRGLAAVPVGGGGAWPGFEATRRAKLAARTARGRATDHGHTKQPGPTAGPSGARNTRGPEAPPEHQRGHKQDPERRHSKQRGARSAAAPRAPRSRVSVAHRLSWMLRPGTASISSRV